VPFNAVPCRLNGGKNPGERAALIIAKNAGGIFRHNDPWAESRNNSEKLTPHPSLIGCASLFSSKAHRLARNATADQVNFPRSAIVWRERLNVAPTRDARPVLCQYAAGVCVYLDLPAAFHAGLLEAKVKAADPGEE
jgi:hypothetical protein